MWAWLKQRMMTSLEAIEICRAPKQKALSTQTLSVRVYYKQGTLSGGPFNNDYQSLSKLSP